MWDKITNKNCKTFFCYFPLFFGNVCLGAQYLDKILLIIIIMGQLKRMDARTYIHERWASRTWPANMFKLYICTH